MINCGVLTRHVWEDNFDEEMSIIRNIITKYPVVSLSTYFPTGTHRVPTGIAWGNSGTNYSKLLWRTNREKSMQVGLAFADEKEKLSCCSETGRPCVWEFNLMLTDGASDPEREEGGSTKWLLDRVGAKKGIDPCRMAAGLWRCNLLMNDDIIWLVFKGGLDFVALLRWVRLSVEGLPLELDEFLRLQRLYFPAFHDIAAVWRFHSVLGDDGTIHVLAWSMGIQMEEMPPTRPASDCLLALRVVTTMKRVLITYTLKTKVRGIFGLTAEEESIYPLPTTSHMAPV